MFGALVLRLHYAVVLVAQGRWTVLTDAHLTCKPPSFLQFAFVYCEVIMKYGRGVSKVIIVCRPEIARVSEYPSTWVQDSHEVTSGPDN